MAEVTVRSGPASSEPSPDVEVGDAGAGDAARYDLRLAVGYREEETAIIKDAWNYLFDSCVIEAGFDPIDRVVVASESPVDAFERRKFDDLERIAVEGYHYLFDSMSVLGEAEAEDQVGDRGLPSVLPDAVEVECKTKANERIAPGRSAREADWFVLEAASEIEDRVAADPVFLEASWAWGICMSEIGYSYSSIVEAVPAMSTFASSNSITPAEIDMALADARCRITSGVNDVRLERISNLVDEWISANSATVVELRSQIDAEVNAARSVLQERGSG